jgi:hypothetical protein
MTSNFNFLRVYNVEVEVRGQALSCNNMTPSDSLPLLSEQITGFSLL